MEDEFLRWLWSSETEFSSDDSALTHSLTLNLPIVLLPATTYLEPSLSVRNGPWHSLECERVSEEAMSGAVGVPSVYRV